MWRFLTPAVWAMVLVCMAFGYTPPRITVAAAILTVVLLSFSDAVEWMIRNGR